jgi:hypothetical protein
LTLLAPATANAAPRACTKSVIAEKIRHQDLLTQAQLDEGGIDAVICADLTGDGRAEGLFTVLSGGSQGDLAYGVLKGGPNNGAGGIVMWLDRPGIAIARRSSTSYEIAFPRFASGDADCCPSAYRIWRYVWRGGPIFAHTSTTTVSSLPSRFRGG